MRNPVRSQAEVEGDAERLERQAGLLLQRVQLPLAHHGEQLPVDRLENRAADGHDHRVVGAGVDIASGGGSGFAERLALAVRGHRLGRFRLAPFAARHLGGSAGEQRGDGQEQHQGEARDQAETGDHRGGGVEQARAAGELGQDLAAQIGVLAAVDTGDDRAGAHRQQQGGNLAHQPVTDRKPRIDVERGLDRHALGEQADADAADEIDGDNDQPGNGIALDEFHRAVHGAEELILLFELDAAQLRFGRSDVAVAQFGIDAHLPARHAVEAEPRRHLGDPLGALGNDEELNGGDDQEDHQSDDQAAPGDEVAEGIDDGAGIGLRQDQARGGDGDRQAERGGDQDDRRQRGELLRPLQIDGDHQHHHRQAEIGGDQQIDQRCRQRDDHDHHDGHQQPDQDDVLALGQRVKKALHRRLSHGR